MKPRTDYEEFESSTDENRRLLRQEELILEVTMALFGSMGKAEISKSQLAERLGKSPAFVTQILSGGRNLTLRTIADVADALGSKVTIHMSRPEDFAIVVPFETETFTNWNWGQVGAPPIQTDRVQSAHLKVVAA